MLRLNASYSKKVPAGVEFSSQQYHASVELELSDALRPDELASRIRDTFRLVRDSVETELRGEAAGETSAKSGPPDAAPRPRGKSTRKAEPASNRQIKFLTDLAVQRGCALGELNRLAGERFGVAGIYELDRRQASRLIDDLSEAQRAA